MRIPVVFDWMERRGRRRKRLMMRGYRVLRQKNRLNFIAEVQQALEETPLSNSDLFSAKAITGDVASNYSLAVKQYLTIRCVGFTLNESVLVAIASNRPGTFVLPRNYRATLKSLDIPVSDIRSDIHWLMFVFFMWIYGVLHSISLLLKFLPFEKVDESPVASAHFYRLLDANLPGECSGSRRRTLLDWYAREWKSDRPIELISHCVKNTSSRVAGNLKVRSNKTEFPIPRTPLDFVKFTVWIMGASLISLGDIFRGRWWTSIMLNEAAKAKSISLCGEEMLASEYWFNNVASIYRPLWTYNAEKRGCKIILYFYSTNNEVFKNCNGPSTQTGNWGLMNWPIYVVWDKRQTDFVQENVGKNVLVIEVGSIPFVDCDSEIPEILGPKIAVFEVQPVRNSYYQKLGVALEFYTSNQAVQFFSDIVNVSKNAGQRILWKKKRAVGKLTARSFAMYVDKELSQSTNLIAIDPNISPHRVIEACDLVISMPFTSTALVGRSQGKPSCYYDALGLIQPDDRAAHGIPIVQGRDALLKWIKKNRNTSE